VELKRLSHRWRNNLNLRLSCIRRIALKRRRKKRNWVKLWMITNLNLMSSIKVWSNQKKLCKLMKKKLRVWIGRSLSWKNKNQKIWPLQMVKLHPAVPKRKTRKTNSKHKKRKMLLTLTNLILKFLRLKVTGKPKKTPWWK
jgi:hypothetical protein